MNNTPHNETGSTHGGRSTVLETASMEWQEGGAEGFFRKLLRSDEETGQRTVLMKMEAGAFYDTHVHTNLEQIYVLEGDFYDEARSYAAGDFIVREAATPHTAGSVKGGLVLLVFG